VARRCSGDSAGSVEQVSKCSEEVIGASLKRAILAS
jgi:hypothetical protein